jgi:hypothetical protein
MCTEQQKVSGTFNPHITLSHFVHQQAAQEARVMVESWWQSLEFPIDRIYLLQRLGDEGQFECVAEFLLGNQEETVVVHDPPKRFAFMPETEADWVREERMKLKSRCRRRGRRW